MNKLKAIIVLALISTFNAAYLTYEAYLLKLWKSTNEFICDINSTFSCSSVFKEDFSWMFGVPFSLIALIVYPIIMLVAYLWITWKISKLKTFNILALLSMWWILFNSYIIFNEFFLKTYCLLCLMCTVIIVSILLISLFWKKEISEKSNVY